MADGAVRLRATLDATIALHATAKANPQPVLDAAAAIVEALQRGGKLLLFGNGGSAADAQHVAAEFVGRFQRERAALAAIALTTDTSVLTSIGERLRVRSRVRAADRGARPQRRRRARDQHQRPIAERRRGAQDGARAGTADDRADRRRRRRDRPAAEIHINVPSTSTPRVQEVHRTLLHVICDLVERAFVEKTLTRRTQSTLL